MGGAQEPARHPGGQSSGRAHRGSPAGYATFEGTIPRGYGGGKVVIWDSGTYEAEKFRDSGDEGGEVIVDLHGQKISGATR